MLFFLGGLRDIVTLHFFLCKPEAFRALMDGLKQVVAKLVIGLVHGQVQLVEAAGGTSKAF